MIGDVENLIDDQTLKLIVPKNHNNGFDVKHSLVKNMKGSTTIYYLNYLYKYWHRLLGIWSRGTVGE